MLVRLALIALVACVPGCVAIAAGDAMAATFPARVFRDPGRVWLPPSEAAVLYAEPIENPQPSCGGPIPRVPLPFKRNRGPALVRWRLASGGDGIEVAFWGSLGGVFLAGSRPCTFFYANRGVAAALRRRRARR